ncbi:MAG: hypothetical protein QNJ34_02425 [Xenococcaceae cyanobacterium MO_188.B29]|nr:hypothetical protein [Xenococcaceae cyanobacterium MO_188.B29]
MWEAISPLSPLSPLSSLSLSQQTTLLTEQYWEEGEVAEKIFSFPIAFF